jgi:hypothetical protein
MTTNYYHRTGRLHYAVRCFTVTCIYLLPVSCRADNAGLLARSQFASGRSCDWPTRLRFSVIFLGPRANAESEPKIHVVLHASHAALPMATLKFRPNVALQMSD